LNEPERNPLTWPKIVSDLEREFSSLSGDWMRSVELRDRIGEIVAGPDFPDLAPDLQGRLDLLHVELVALTRENVCTNEPVPPLQEELQDEINDHLRQLQDGHPRLLRRVVRE